MVLLVLPKDQPAAVQNLIVSLSLAVPCNFSTHISIYVGGKEIKIFPETFKISPLFEDPDTCIAGAVSNDALTGSKFAASLSGPFPGVDQKKKADFGHNTEFWIIGVPFLQNVYTVWDVGRKRIGFADLVYLIKWGYNI